MKDYAIGNLIILLGALVLVGLFIFASISMNTGLKTNYKGGMHYENDGCVPPHVTGK